MSILNVNTIQPIGSGTTVTVAATELKTSNFITVGTGASITSPSANVLTLGTNTAERLRITSVGYLGLGTNNPSYLIDAHTSSGNAQLRVKSGGDLSQLILESTDTSGYSQINFADAGSNNIGMLQYFHSDNHMEFTVNGSERLRITSAGLVRVPDNGKFTAGAGDDLQIYHDGSHTYANNTTGYFHIRSGSEIRLQKTGGERMIYAIPDGAVELYYDDTKRFETLSNGTQTTGRIFLNGTNGGFDYNNTAHTLEYLVNGSTHSELNTGAYVPQGTKNLGSNAKRWGTLYLSTGIDFGANSNAAGMTSEVLDDYEEGTWTPTITGLGNHNNNAGSTWGKYTKIGNRVFITWRYSWTSRTTTNGGVVFLGSLPFSAPNDSQSDAVYIGGLEGIISNTGREVYGGQVVYNTNTIQFRASGHNVSENSLFGSLSTSMSSGYIYGGANYIV